MVKHPEQVEGFDGSLEDLAKAVGNMTYDQTASFLEKLADDLRRQADADLARGRKQLASKLYATSEELLSSRDKMNLAWKVCAPYMK